MFCVTLYHSPCCLFSPLRKRYPCKSNCIGKSKVGYFFECRCQCEDPAAKKTTSYSHEDNNNNDDEDDDNNDNNNNKILLLVKVVVKKQCQPTIM